MLVEPDVAIRHEVGQEHAVQRLGDRVDLEAGVLIHCSRVIVWRGTVRPVVLVVVPAGQLVDEVSLLPLVVLAGRQGGEAGEEHRPGAVVGDAFARPSGSRRALQRSHPRLQLVEPVFHRHVGNISFLRRIVKPYRAGSRLVIVFLGASSRSTPGGMRRTADGVVDAVKVEIWSDIACPWCHIGKRRFEAALKLFPHRDQIEVRWKSFELDPGAGTATGSTVDRNEPEDRDYADRLAAKYGTSRTGAQQMLDTMTEAAAAEGLDFRFDRARKANTFHAHQLLHLAAERGVQDAVKERLLLAYFTQGQALGDRDVLVRLAAEARLDADEVRQVLGDQRFASAVRADEAEAAALGIRGVPFFVVDRRYAVSGAQPADQLLEVLRRAWAERQPLTLVGAGEGDPTCGPDGCTT